MYERPTRVTVPDLSPSVDFGTRVYYGPKLIFTFKDDFFFSPGFSLHPPLKFPFNLLPTFLWQI